MSQHASTHRARPGLEHLEGRCTPSALLGSSSVHLLAHHSGPHAAAVAHLGVHHGRAVPITVFLHCTGDTSSMKLSSRGFATVLGRWTGRGHIDNIEGDAAANRIVIRGTTTIVTATRDKLYVTFSTAWRLSSRLCEETVTFTGGTGRFAGASGAASLVCRLTVDRLSPLKLECDGQGAGTLVLVHR
jgi:hypothetical protein